MSAVEKGLGSGHASSHFSVKSVHQLSSKWTAPLIDAGVDCGEDRNRLPHGITSLVKCPPKSNQIWYQITWAFSRLQRNAFDWHLNKSLNLKPRKHSCCCTSNRARRGLPRRVGCPCTIPRHRWRLHLQGILPPRSIYSSSMHMMTMTMLAARKHCSQMLDPAKAWHGIRSFS